MRARTHTHIVVRFTAQLLPAFFSLLSSSSRLASQSAWHSFHFLNGQNLDRSRTFPRGGQQASPGLKTVARTALTFNVYQVFFKNRSSFLEITRALRTASFQTLLRQMPAWSRRTFYTSPRRFSLGILLLLCVCGFFITRPVPLKVNDSLDRRFSWVPVIADSGAMTRAATAGVPWPSM